MFVSVVQKRSPCACFYSVMTTAVPPAHKAESQSVWHCHLCGGTLVTVTSLSKEDIKATLKGDADKTVARGLFTTERFGFFLGESQSCRETSSWLGRSGSVVTVYFQESVGQCELKPRRTEQLQPESSLVLDLPSNSLWRAKSSAVPSASRA